MGEAAEDILDGTVCEGCGEFFDDITDGDEPPGFPRRCTSCEPPRRSKKRRRATAFAGRQCDPRRPA